VKTVKTDQIVKSTYTHYVRGLTINNL